MKAPYYACTKFSDTYNAVGICTACHKSNSLQQRYFFFCSPALSTSLPTFSLSVANDATCQLRCFIVILKHRSRPTLVKTSANISTAKPWMIFIPEHCCPIRTTTRSSTGVKTSLRSDFTVTFFFGHLRQPFQLLEYQIWWAGGVNQKQPPALPRRAVCFWLR